MKNEFIALVGVHMLAELIDTEKLMRALEALPRLPQWGDVRQVLQQELGRRDLPVDQAAAAESRPAADAA